MESGLKRIILIDSYIAGEQIEIKLDGHTVINGANGKGKTSLLTLIPLYYGVLPGSLIKKSDGGRESFVNFYLPRAGSYIIYEYAAHGSLKMAVFSTLPSSQESFRRLLIDSPYRSDLFLSEDEKSSLPAESIISRLNEAGIYYKSHKNVDEYKRNLLVSGNFSVAAKGNKLTHLTDLLANMFQKKSSFDDLARIIQDWSTQRLDSRAIQELENFSINKDKLQNIVNDYSALSGLDRLAGQSPSILNLVNDLDEYDLDMAAILARSSSLSKEFKEKSAASVEAFKEDTTKYNESFKTKKQTISELSEESRQLTKQAAEVKAESQGIDYQYQAYIKEGVLGYSSELLEFDSLYSRDETLSKLINSSQDKTEEITGFIQTKKQAVIEQAEADTQAQHALLHEVQESLITQQEEAAKTHQAELKAFDTESALGRQRFLDAEKQSSINLEVAKSKKATPAATEETLSALALARSNQKQFDDTREALEITRAAQQEAANLSNKKYNEHNDDLTAIYEEQSDVENKLKPLVDLRDKSGTLYQFLETNVENWKQSVGKVLPEDVLLNNKLSPEKAQNGNSDSLYGVTLDLAALPEKDFDIEKQIDALEKQVAQLLTQETKVNKSLSTALSAKTAADSALAQTKESIRQNTKKYDEAKRRVQELVDREAAEKANYLSTVNQEIERLSQVDNSKKADLAGYDKRQTQLREQKISNHASELKSIKDDSALLQVAIRDRIKAIAKQKNIDLQTLDKALTEKLSSAGVDTDEITKLQNQRNELQEKIKSLTHKQNRLDGYKLFMESEYPKLTELTTRLTALNNQIFTIGEKITTTQSEIESLNEAHKKRELQHTALINQLDRDMGILQSIASASVEDMVMAPEDRIALWEGYDASKLRSRFGEIQTKHTESRRDLRVLLEPYVNSFTRHENAVTSPYYHDYIMPHLERSDHREAGRSIVRYYKDNHTQSIKALNQRISENVNVESYKNYIESFENSVNYFGRRVNAEMRDSVRFESLTSVELDLRFNPRNMDNWSSISDLANAHRKWEDNRNLDVLPDEEIIHATRMFISSMSGSRMTSNVTDMWRYIQFNFKIIENGTLKHVTTEKGLVDVSSTGISYLILIVTFLGFIDLQRGENKTPLTWSLDELTNIDGKNVDALLDLLSEKNIYMVAACPQLSYFEIQRFSNGYLFEVDNHNKTVILPIDLKDDLDSDDFDEYINEIATDKETV